MLSTAQSQVLEKEIHQCNGKYGSQFWKGINKVKRNIRWVCKAMVRNGKDTIFWEDIWVGETPLKLIFPRLFEYCRNKSCMVNECWKDGEWTMQFRRSLSPEDALQWEAFVETIKDIQVTS